MFFQTKVGEPINCPEWNEVFVYEFEQEDIKDHGKFEISLFYMENVLLNTKRIIDKKYTFDFSELTNQRVNEKIIKLRKSSCDIFGEIYLRVQLVVNYEKFLSDWINELEVKLEIIERILKVNADILSATLERPHRSSDLSKKINYKEVGEENYIEMTTISRSWEAPNIENLSQAVVKSPLLFGSKPPLILKVDELSKDGLEDCPKDKNEYFENHFFIK